MREHKRDKGRLEDIIKYAKNVEQIINGVSFEEFCSDIRIYYSVMKNIEVIGEACNMLTRDFKSVYTTIPWRNIVSMRNILVHGYSNVSEIDVYNAAVSDITPLKKQIEELLLSVDWDLWNNSPQEFSEMDNSAYKKTLETARNLKQMNLTTEQIIIATGLSEKEVNEL